MKDNSEFLRKDVLRLNCKSCGGNGYTTINGVEQGCSACEGSGTEEREVEYKFEGPRTDEELAQIFETTEDDVQKRKIKGEVL